MPVNRKMMKSMKEQYGSKKGEDIYYAVEQKQKKRGMAKGGLWENIHAKRERIAAGSGEKMRKPGSKGAPSAKAFKAAQGMNKGGMPMHKMPDGTMMKGAKHGYAHGGLACGASNPAARPMKKK